MYFMFFISPPPLSPLSWVPCVTASPTAHPLSSVLQYKYCITCLHDISLTYTVLIFYDMSSCKPPVLGPVLIFYHMSSWCPPFVCRRRLLRASLRTMVSVEWFGCMSMAGIRSDQLRRNGGGGGTNGFWTLY